MHGFEAGTGMGHLKSKKKSHVPQRNSEMKGSMVVTQSLRQKGTRSQRATEAAVG